jgi:cell shape-determining protein MreD
MNRVVFALAAWVFVGLEWGLRDVLQVGRLQVAPSFVLILAAMIGLWASPGAALGGALVLGVCLDLMYQIPHEGLKKDVVVLGPHALGLALGVIVILNVRALVFRKNTVTLAVLTGLAGAFAAVVVTALLSVRALYDPIQIGRPIAELGARCASALVTAGLALPVGFVLTRTRRLFGFATDRRGGFRIESTRGV